MKKLAILTCALLLSLSVSVTCTAQNRTNNQKKLKNWAARHDLTATKYQKEVEKYHNSGFKLVYVDGYNINGNVKFAALWKKGKVDGLIAKHGLSAEAYQKEVDKNHGNGYRLVHVDGYQKDGKARFAAIWEKKSTKGLVARHNLTGATYQSEALKQQKDGYKLVHISGYAIGGKAYYAAIWKVGNNKDQITRHGLTSSAYQTEVNKNWKNGYRVMQVDSYDVNGKVYYAAIFEKITGDFSARHNLSPLNYQLTIDNHFYQGYIPMSVSGHDAGKSAGYAATFKNVGGWEARDTRRLEKNIETVMKKYGIPGASIAIVKDGKLKYAKGFGFGNKEKNEIAAATSLFRVASISKPITAVAVLKLEEERKINLQQKVFGAQAILGTKYGKEPYGKREKAITVSNLLEHRAGGNAWDNNTDPNPSSGPADNWNAPMFQQLDKKKGALISWVLDTRNPSEKVNTVSAYSNFGYCVLGRIIDEKSNSSYEEYVKNKILRPCGITNMKIGSSTKEGRAFKEVVYYSTGNPYSLKMRRMDSHGGWIASTVDLMRFAVRVDGKTNKKDILSPRSIAKMQSSSYGGRYGKGWDLNNALMQHGGRMNGTRARLKLMENGIYYAYAVNKYSRGDEEKGKSLNGDMSKAIETAIQEISYWPDIDLF